jgi:hypothetical protein
MTAPQHTTPHSTRWRKSSHSTGQTDCVEVAQADDVYMVRDSKNPDAARLTFAADIWQRFTGEIKHGTHRSRTLVPRLAVGSKSVRFS